MSAILEESLALFEQLDETRGVALAQVNLAHVARNERDYRRALDLFKASLRRYRAVGDKRGQAECLVGCFPRRDYSDFEHVRQS